MEQDDFFTEYEKAAKKQLPVGIPGFTMNRPIVTNSLVGTVGLELELEASNNLPRDRDISHIIGNKTGAGWNGHADGSLRGNSIEYIVNRPIGRDEIGPMIDGLYHAMATYGTKLQLSNRCSTHVHVNMTGKGINEITSAIVLWGIFEQALIAFCGEERKTNHFCLSSKESKNTIEAWSSLLNYGNSQFSRNLKYSALNIMPLYTQGSLEFRCGRASKTPDYPVVWATLIDTLVSFAASQYPNPRTLANDLSERGAIGLLEALVGSEPLLPNNLVGQIVDVTPGFENECLGSFRNYQELALAHPWEEWIELIKAPYIPNPFDTPKGKRPSTAGGERIRFTRGLEPFPPVPEPRGGDQIGRILREAGQRDREQDWPGAAEVAQEMEVEFAPVPAPVPEERPMERRELLLTRFSELNARRVLINEHIQMNRVRGRRPDQVRVRELRDIDREMTVLRADLGMA